MSRVHRIIISWWWWVIVFFFFNIARQFLTSQYAFWRMFIRLLFTALFVGFACFVPLLPPAHKIFIKLCGGCFQLFRVFLELHFKVGFLSCLWQRLISFSSPTPFFTSPLPCFETKELRDKYPPSMCSVYGYVISNNVTPCNAYLSELIIIMIKRV